MTNLEGILYYKLRETARHENLTGLVRLLKIHGDDGEAVKAIQAAVDDCPHPLIQSDKNQVMNNFYTKTGLFAPPVVVAELEEAFRYATMAMVEKINSLEEQLQKVKPSGKKSKPTGKNKPKG